MSGSENDDPPIEPVYPIETLILLFASLQGSLARGIGKQVLDEALEETPAVEVESNPQSSEPNLNDTKTWPKPPREGEYKEGAPTRSKPESRGEKSLYDENGGEWRYSKEDKYHNEHWDYKPPGRNQEWENIPIGDKPPVK